MPHIDGEIPDIFLDQETMLNTEASVDDDGRISINIGQTSPATQGVRHPTPRTIFESRDSPYTAEGVYPVNPGSDELPERIGLCLNIVIQIVGSRGDIQPFIALGKHLKHQYGHRVRIATHLSFKSFVEEHDLEFFNIGGDAAELMAFMVNNSGLFPDLQAFRDGDVGRRRKGIYEILKGCWRSCIEAGDGTGPRPTSDDYASLRACSGVGQSEAPFIADVIVANPPSFAHIHCAERLGIPVHIMFTMPWTPTQAFAHPLAIVRSSSVAKGFTNFISYAMVSKVIWHGLGDVINLFRQRCLNLEPISIIWAPGMISRLKIPVTYCWSPTILQKPTDWAPHISVAGSFNLPLASNFLPAPTLIEFLKNGSQPIYIGFGSIVVKNAAVLTRLLFEAVARSGQRALISAGWAGLASCAVPEDVLVIGNVPHDWLFDKVSLVVHHGGAGTTAAGLAAGKPTIVIPFFGDQLFWGETVERAGAGPKPIPYKTLTADNLAAAIKQALQPVIVKTAARLGQLMSIENGCENGANSLHTNLPTERLRCSILPDRPAIWRTTNRYRSMEYEPESGPWEPITGGASALLGSFGNLVTGGAQIVSNLQYHFLSHQSPQGRTSESNAVDSLTTASGTSGAMCDPKSCQDQQALSQSHLTSGMKKAAPEVCGTWGHKSHNRSRNVERYLSDHGGHFIASGLGSVMDATSDTARAVAKVGFICLSLPGNLTLSVARGFHNAPRLYGDHTVRTPLKVTGIQSGLKAAGSLFGFGMFDAITGLATQPLRGAQRDGITGFIKGGGKGLGGFVLKPAAAILALPAYTLKGIHIELEKQVRPTFSAYIKGIRTGQGEKEWQQATAQEIAAVVSRSKVLGISMQSTGG
ncbi:hypothetical protein LTR72_011683 [Exophiala xenobiotica]|nr:hypothetical protein LTR92_011249 [Exophiala xenobiotica]KAK5215248.1 hypothetical protein LTR72_011683 [Exophiala xenobiotica]